MSSPASSSPLARFPADVRAAYERFCAEQNPKDLEIIVHAAIRDFMPKRPDRPAGGTLTADQRLIEDLGFDSLAIAETVFFFEDVFQVSIQNQEILTLKTIGDLETFVNRKLAERTSTP